MKIFERAGILPEYRKVHTEVLKKDDVSVKSVRDDDLTGPEAEADVYLLEEYLFQIFVNSVPVMQLVCTPTFLPELVIGRLLTEGYISSIEEVRLVDICRNGNTAKVFLTDKTDERPADPGETVVEMVSSCCTDNRTLNDLYRRSMQLQPVPSFSWNPSLIWELEERFREDTKIHEKTHATHSCFLCYDGDIIFEAEDIGRHNAVDKAVGYAVRNEIPLSECVIYTTGRMPVDMVRKVIRAGIPVMVSKEAPTVESLQLAKEYGLSLIGNLKHGRMCVYNRPGH